MFLLCVLALLLGNAESICDNEQILQVRTLWGSGEPTGLLDQLVGTMTYLYIPPMLSTTPGLKCIKTVLDDSKLAEDYHMYEEDARIIGKYWMKETEYNITRSFVIDGDSDGSDDFVLPVYLNNGVFGFWQCRHDYDPFINIGVLHYTMRKEEEEVKRAIQEAENWLEQLRMDFPPRISGEC